MNEETAIQRYNGRIISHIIAELINDVIPNYCYNSTTERYVLRNRVRQTLLRLHWLDASRRRCIRRFVPTRVPLIDPVQRSHVPKPVAAYMFGSKVRAVPTTEPGRHWLTESLLVSGRRCCCGPTQSLNQAYNAICDVHYRYIGEIHFQMMLRIQGRQYLPVLQGELANNFYQLVRFCDLHDSRTS